MKIPYTIKRPYTAVAINIEALHDFASARIDCGIGICQPLTC